MSSVACVDRDTDVGTVGVVVGSLLVVGTIVTPLPQFVKIVRLGSADGVSLPTLSFIVANQAACAAGIVIVKFRVMRRCDSVRCLAQLLDLAQQLACCLTYVALVRVVAGLETDRVKRRAAAASVIFAVAVLAGAVAVSLGGACRKFALYSGGALSLLNSVCVIIGYLPQLLQTWRCGHSGAMSYATYSLSIVGCGIIFVNDAFYDEDPWPAWLPSSVAGIIQLAIMGLAFVLDRRRGKPAPAAEEGYAPLAAAAGAAASDVPSVAHPLNLT
jgi:cystinosin